MSNWTAFLVLLLIAALLTECAPRDNTDPTGGRSGMALYTDALTGCQYLARPGLLGVFATSLTPRIDQSGKPICAKETRP